MPSSATVCRNRMYNLSKRERKPSVCTGQFHDDSNVGQGCHESVVTGRHPRNLRVGRIPIGVRMRGIHSRQFLAVPQDACIQSRHGQERPDALERLEAAVDGDEIPVVFGGEMAPWKESVITWLALAIRWFH